jgi:ubiquitin-conjugating enzyme E2 U
MYSRAHLLIENDLNELANNPINGIVVFKLFENNFFDIVAKIEGLPNTIWESGMFQVYLKFNEYYNDAPPLVSFQTIPFHPNIDVTSGRPSVDFLDDISKWKNEYSIKFILQSLQQLLANPLLDRAVNMDAVFMLKGNPERYNKIAVESVIASQRLQKGLAPFPGHHYSKNNFVKIGETLSSNTINSGIGGFISNSHNSQPATPLYSTNTITASATIPMDGGKSFISNRDSNKNTKRISFEDYYRLWKGIATSKEAESAENIYIKYDLNQNPVQMAQHLGLTIKDLELQMMQQLNDHKNIMYGKFDFKQNDTTAAEDLNRSDKSVSNNLKRISKMKEVYLRKNKEDIQLSDLQTERSNPSFTLKKQRSNNGNWENEVDDLVNWTENLNENII